MPGTGASTQSNTANPVKDDCMANGNEDGDVVTALPIFIIDAQNYLTVVSAHLAWVSPDSTIDQSGNDGALKASPLPPMKPQTHPIDLGVSQVFLAPLPL
jgi:hypothetical protein